MKNYLKNKYIRLGCGALAAVLAFTMALPGIGMTKAEAGTDTEKMEQESQIADAVESVLSSKSENDSGRTEQKKEETVYINADETGKVSEIVVSDWLKNGKGETELKDVSDLEQIENVKGNETYTLKNDELVWKTEGNDIYYQGTTKKEVPVGVKVTYYLDGKEILYKDLEGKSGKVKIRFDYINNEKQKIDVDGKEEEVYVPFTMVTGFILPTEKFSNIEVENGHVESDANNNIVVGIAFPGLKESLGLSEEDSEKIKIPDYMEVSADVEDFSMDMTMTVALADVLSEFDFDGIDSVEDLEKSVNDLNEASDSLSKGSSDLYNGIKTLQEKSEDLVEGVNTLNEKTGEFNSGVNSLVSGIGELSSGAGTLAAGTAQLSQGAAQLSQKTGEFVEGMASAKQGSDDLAAGLGQVISGISGLGTKIQEAEDGIGKLQAGIQKADSAYDTLGTTVSNDEAIIAALEQVNQAYNDPTLETIIGQLKDNTSGQRTLYEKMKSGTTELMQGTEQLAQGTMDLAGELTKEDGLVNGLNQLYEGSVNLKQGLGTLYEGSVQLKSGADTLYGGTSEVNSGANELANGTKTLLNGGNQLEDGSNQLADGVKTLTDGSKTLVGGVGQLTDGASDLKDGMVKFDEEGIKKLTEALDGNAEELIDRIRAIAKAGKEYTCFTGISEDMEGSVKFIIKTDREEK